MDKSFVYKKIYGIKIMVLLLVHFHGKCIQKHDSLRSSKEEGVPETEVCTELFSEMS